MAFKKGQSGNPSGGAREKIITQRLIAGLKEASGQRLHKFANALLDKAIDGDVAAMREVIDRVEGKAPQVIAGDPESPLPVSIRIMLVDAPAK